MSDCGVGATGLEISGPRCLPPDDRPRLIGSNRGFMAHLLVDTSDEIGATATFVQLPGLSRAALEVLKRTRIRHVRVSVTSRRRQRLHSMALSSSTALHALDARGHDGSDVCLSQEMEWKWVVRCSALQENDAAPMYTTALQRAVPASRIHSDLAPSSIGRELLDYTGLVFEYWCDGLAIDECTTEPPPGLSVDSQFV
jgi:hypothetical protein